MTQYCFSISPFLAWGTLALETKDLCDSFPIDVNPPLQCVWAMSSIFFCVCTIDLKPGSLIWSGNQQPERWRAVSVLVTHLQCAACLSFTFSAILLVNHWSYYQSLACVVFDVLGCADHWKGTIEKLKLLSFVYLLLLHIIFIFGCWWGYYHAQSVSAVCFFS